MRGLGVACKGIGFQHSKRAAANRQKPQIPVHVIPFLLIRCKPLMIRCSLHHFFRGKQPELHVCESPVRK